MPPTQPSASSARALTFAAYISFVPIGMVTVLLGPMLPILSSRWALNYSQAGALFTAQYIASTCAVAVSGYIASRWGFRLAISCGLVLTTVALSLLLSGSHAFGVFCISLYGFGQGVSVPAANLLVAELNPTRRSATLNLLNFFWSVGAVSCPFLVATASRFHHIGVFLGFVAAVSLAVAVGIMLLPLQRHDDPSAGGLQLIHWSALVHTRAFLVLSVLFFLYVGTENAFGGWIASYSKSLGSLAPAFALVTPSFFYAALTVGRVLAPFLLRAFTELTLARVGLLLACCGMAGLMFSHSVVAVIASACLAGVGLSHVYPITIALLSSCFGSASTRTASIMFVLSNIGGGLLPWIVGVTSNRVGSLTAGLLVPFLGGAFMLLLYVGFWSKDSEGIAAS